MDFRTMKTRTIITRYMLPQMVGLVFNSVYFIVDGVLIGHRLGAGALAAAGVAVPVVEGMIALSMLIAVGAGVLISAAAGRGEENAARNAFVHALGLALGLSAAVAVLGNLFVTPLALALGASPETLGMAVSYLRYFLGFSPFLVFSFLLSTLARNDGRPRLAMWALTAGSLSNVLLDWVFMYPLNMGIAGAALATGLGPVFSVLLLLPHFLGKRGRLYLQRPGWEPGLLRRMLAGGTPAFLSEFSIGLVTLFYNRAIVAAGLGDEGLASYLVIGYAALICLTAFLGAAQGAQPAVSFLSGAGEEGRVRRLLRASLLFQGSLALGLYLALLLGGQVFFGIFLREDPALLARTAQVAGIYFLNLPFAAAGILLLSFLQAMGRTGGALLLSLSRSTLPVMAALVLLPRLLPQNGLWLALCAAELFTALLAVVVWRAGKPAGRVEAAPARRRRARA